jgi:hypothetical protein
MSQHLRSLPSFCKEFYSYHILRDRDLVIAVLSQAGEKYEEDGDIWYRYCMRTKRESRTGFPTGPGNVVLQGTSNIVAVRGDITSPLTTRDLSLS